NNRAQGQQEILKKSFYCEADIIISTCGSAQSPAFTEYRSGLKYTVAIVDEASQAHERELLQPLHLTRLRCMILVGDGAQLGPTIISPVLLNYPLADLSLFTRLVDHLPPQLVVRLERQTRMRPRVARLVARLSYCSTCPLLSPDWHELRRHI